MVNELEEMKHATNEVKGIVTSDRHKCYGTPSENHSVTGAMWGLFLTRKLGIPINITGADVCWMNMLQKASRQAHWPKRDNAIDAAGYAVNAIACEVKDEVYAPEAQGFASEDFALQDDNAGVVPRLPTQHGEGQFAPTGPQGHYVEHDGEDLSIFPIRGERVYPGPSQADGFSDSPSGCQRVSVEQSDGEDACCGRGETASDEESCRAALQEALQHWDAEAPRWPSKRPY